MTIRYISTRGNVPVLNFEEAVLTGLAPDGGLFVPEHIPEFSMAEIAAMQSLSYPELAYTIISRFAGGIDPAALKKIIADSYKTFRHPAVAPLAQLDTHTFVLELFHGPTLAFKDFALQFLGRLLDHILEKRGQSATVIGATSGDTGSAAIAGCRGRSNMDIFILHPHKRVSNVQRRQMTTVSDKNVHNIAIKGTFDDCQDIVKTLFQLYNPLPLRDGAGGGVSSAAPPSPTLPHKGGGRRLVAVNSINWARIVAQVPYYFYAALQLGAPARRVSFSVPTGNFGDIYAGHVARRMGLPIHQLIIATNRNDILARTLATGIYGMAKVVPTLSPSMDIQVSSNFERLLFDLYGRDGKTIAAMMAKFKTEKKLALSPAAWSALKAEFSACTIDDKETQKTIGDTYKATGCLLDPHSAVGLAAGERCRSDTATPLVVLATAHPAKFPEAVKKAARTAPALPAPLKGLMKRKERFTILPNSAGRVKTLIEKA